jgi:hypothetical protein
MLVLLILHLKVLSIVISSRQLIFPHNALILDHTFHMLISLVGTELTVGLVYEVLVFVHC